ncbi:hypothetical protein GJ744_005028 [Endocarpon pusillum]|uniref:Uncharacterized protein n=1 Tax=Endocarpon pusillum TaxID=364733 RepID=A0A8H7A541_9EURO|nr:hypothetical protein GJ744_005028 [Endocarpon pusillum]
MFKIPRRNIQMPHQSDSHEVPHLTSDDQNASNVEHPLQSERRDRAAQGSLPVSRESADDQDADGKTEPEPLDSWAWMYDIDYEECFIEYDPEAAAKSSDFGNDGYTASLTNWHELLQLTAPDPKCGLIYIRGDFPDTSDAILARVQNQYLAGGKGAFGIQLLHDPADEFRLGRVATNGLINYRWPHTQYWLDSEKFNAGT